MTNENTVDSGAPVVPAPGDGGGLGSSLLERARKAKGSAVAKAADLAAKAGEAKEHASAKASELKDAGFHKITETLAEFNAALPVISAAGYTLGSVDVGIGIPPKISASFTATDLVSEERFEQLLVENADKKFTRILMKALHDAWRLQKKVHILGLAPKAISVELGLIPSIAVKFG